MQKVDRRKILGLSGLGLVSLSTLAALQNLKSGESSILETGKGSFDQIDEYTAGSGIKLLKKAILKDQVGSVDRVIVDENGIVKVKDTAGAEGRYISRTSIQQLLDADIDPSVVWPTSRIPNLDASKITTGRFPTARLPDSAANTVLKGQGTGLDPAYGKIVDADIDANAAISKSKISTVGTWAASDIPNLDASKITTGRFTLSRLPDAASGTVLKGKGIGVDPAYEALTAAELPAHKDRHVSGGTDAFTSTDVIEAATKRLRTSDPVTLDIGSIQDGQFLKRSGTQIVGGGLTDYNNYEVADHFTTTPSTIEDGEVGEMGWGIAVNGGTINHHGGSLNTFGVISLATSTGAGYYAYIAKRFARTTAHLELEARVIFEVVGQSLQFGLKSEYGLSNSSLSYEGAYFILLGNTLYSRTADGLNITETNLNVNIYGWKLLKIVNRVTAIDGVRDVQFYVNNNLVATHTTNLPEDVLLDPYFSVISSASSGGVMSIDWFRMRVRF